MEKIRHVSTSFQGNIIAVAEFEKKVQIVDVLKQKVISEFETVLDFGGRRLAITETGEICICGCWERFGICGYETSTGRMIWKREDLKKVQKIEIIRSNINAVFAQFASGVSRFLDIKTGNDILELRGVKNYYESRFQPVNVYDRSAKIEITDRQTHAVLAKIEHQSFAILDVAFSPDSVLISEAGGPLSCYYTNNGELKWRVPKDEKEHYTRIGFVEEIGAYICLSHPFEHADKKLIYVNCHKGIIENQLDIHQPIVAEFLFKDEFLATSNRELIAVKSGNITKW
jgi:hypothetical protein